MGIPDPSSRASRALRLLRLPMSVAAVAERLGCEHREAQDALHSLHRHKRARKLYSLEDGHVAYVRQDRPWSRGEWSTDPTPEEPVLPTTDVKDLLYAAFRRRGISQAELARLSGVPQTHISSALDPERYGPSPESLAAMLKALGFRMTLVDVTE